MSTMSATLKFSAIGVGFLIPYLFFLYLKFFKYRYKFDVHENGFAFYFGNKIVISAWNEVESITRFAKGFRLKTLNGDCASIIGNGNELKELDKLFAEKLTKILLDRIRAKIKNGEKVHFGLNHGQTIFAAKLSEYLHGNGGFTVDLKGVYNNGQLNNYGDFIKWKDVGSFGITDLGFNSVGKRGNPQLAFRVAAENKNFHHSIWIVENLEILKVICADFCPQIKTLNDAEELAELEKLVAQIS